jgi:hypothetical protein
MPAELLTRPGGGAPAFCDLRGRIQADIVDGLPGHFRRMVMAPDQLHDWQRDRLRLLLASAMQRSAFHARRLHGIDPARFELADLPSLPVMTKAQMMDLFDDLISDRLLTREAAEGALAATHDEPRPLPGGYMCMATGGSSGQRGIFAYDPVSVAEFVSLIWSSTARRSWPSRSAPSSRRRRRPASTPAGWAGRPRSRTTSRPQPCSGSWPSTSAGPSAPDRHRANNPCCCTRGDGRVVPCQQRSFAAVGCFRERRTPTPRPLREQA